MGVTGSWKPLDESLKSGDPIAKVQARDLLRVFRVLNRIQVIGGELIKSPDGMNWVLRIGDDSLGEVAQRNVYLAGVKYGPFDDPEKQFIRVQVDVNTVTEDSGPMPEPFPPGEEWYDKRTTPPGDIHVTRFG